MRTEHVEVTTQPVHTFRLDFLGKDSIRYTNEITLDKVPEEFLSKRRRVCARAC